MLHSHLDEATLQKRRLDGIERVVSQEKFRGYETLVVRKLETPFDLRHRVEKAWSRLPKIFGSFKGAVDDRLKLLYKRDEFPLLRRWNIKKRPRDEGDGKESESDLDTSPKHPSKKVR
jgi:hypothetical protein